jgi:MOSC domain-containing protein YiiM
VVAVSSSPVHAVIKENRPFIRLVAGLGVESDTHAGVTVQHRSRVARDPNQPNLRQVHLIHTELHRELQQAGFEVEAGTMGENITTENVDLLGLPTGARLQLGREAVIEITGLRNPCQQLNGLQDGLMKAVLGRDEQGNLIRKAGVMAVVIRGGEIRPGDPITIELPPEPHQPLEPV